MAGYKHLEIPGNFERYVKDKRQSANSYFRYFLARLSRMFEYKNLPDTIPHEILDRYLFVNGIALITEVNGDLYAFYGNLGGPQDVYYRPTEFIVSNPHIKTSNGELFTANVPVFETSDQSVGQPTGVLIRNDTEWIGLTPMLSRYAYLMAENILTLRTADVMLRILALITAPSDKEKASALEYLRAIENGNLSVISESPFFDGVKMQSPPSNNGSYLTQFIEYQQYLKGSLYNEIGLSANYNMKREAIGKGESTLDEDALLPLADNMLLCRRQDLQKVNDMFGTSIEVQFSSSWLENAIETLKLLSSSSSVASGGSTHMTPQGQFGAADGSGDGPIEEDGANDKDGVVGADGAEGADGAPGRTPENETKRKDEDSDEGREGDDDRRDDEDNKDGDDRDDSIAGCEINDLSQDENLDTILEQVEDGLTHDDMPVTGEEVSDDSDEKETKADEGSDSAE